jgi:hypothetical protein
MGRLGLWLGMAFVGMVWVGASVQRVLAARDVVWGGGAIFVAGVEIDWVYELLESLIPREEKSRRTGEQETAGEPLARLLNLNDQRSFR